MEMIMLILLSPILLGICLVLCKKERIQKEKEKQAEQEKLLNKPPRGIYTKHFVSENELRATKKVRTGKVTHITKSKLDMFLEEHGLQIADYMQRDKFFIPISSCNDIKEELCQWFNNLPEVEYALLEEDGIYVNVRRDM